MLYLLYLLLYCQAFTRAAGSVPVLCYHHVKTSAAGHVPAYTISVARLQEHLQMLHDSGYHTITPDELYLHETKGRRLPDKPVMLTFDDDHEEQYLLALPLLKRYHFKAVFFVMTVTVGKPGYMRNTQLRTLSDSGHVIGLHTWDHPDLRNLPAVAWGIQVDAPRRLLERITGRAVVHFAYPYGAWDTSAIRQLKARGIITAYQLAGRQSDTDPLYTIRRILVHGNWSAQQLYRQLQQP